jgi:hypothetical protein
MEYESYLPRWQELSTRPHAKSDQSVPYNLILVL